MKKQKLIYFRCIGGLCFPGCYFPLVTVLYFIQQKVPVLYFENLIFIVSGDGFFPNVINVELYFVFFLWLFFFQACIKVSSAIIAENNISATLLCITYSSLRDIYDVITFHIVRLFPILLYIEFEIM